MTTSRISLNIKVLTTDFILQALLILIIILRKKIIIKIKIIIIITKIKIIIILRTYYHDKYESLP